MASLTSRSLDSGSDAKLSGVRKLLLVGFAIALAGFVLLMVAAGLSSQSGSSSSGAIIFIGPIPIIFGAGTEAPWLILLASVLTVFGIVAFLVLHRETKNAGI